MIEVFSIRNYAEIAPRKRMRQINTLKQMERI